MATALVDVKIFNQCLQAKGCPLSANGRIILLQLDLNCFSYIKTVLRSTPPGTRGGKSISGTQNRRRIQKGICSQKSGGDFFIKKELNKALGGTIPIAYQIWDLTKKHQRNKLVLVITGRKKVLVITKLLQ